MLCQLNSKGKYFEVVNVTCNAIDDYIHLLKMLCVQSWKVKSCILCGMNGS